MALDRFKTGSLVPLEGGEEFVEIEQFQDIRSMEDLRRHFFESIDKDVLAEKVKEMCESNPREIFHIAAQISPKEISAKGQMSIEHLLGEVGPMSAREKKLIEKSNYELDAGATPSPLKEVEGNVCDVLFEEILEEEKER